MRILPAALADAEEALVWWMDEAPTLAGAWYRGLLAAIASLEELPSRCPIAGDESKALGIEIRKLLYRRGAQVYRIYFRITDEHVVCVLRLRHTSRDQIDPAELTE